MESTEHTTHPLKLNLKTVRSMLVQFIKDEVTNTGLAKAVVGLSGGIDSAVAAYLAAEALGKKNVLVDDAVTLGAKPQPVHQQVDAVA